MEDQNANNKVLIDSIEELYEKTLICWCVPKSSRGQILVNICKPR